MSPYMGLILPVASILMRGDEYIGMINASSVSSIKPAVVLASTVGSILFCNSNDGLKKQK